MACDPKTTTNPQMTVKQLLTAMTAALATHGDVPVSVWLPGSLVDLHQVMGIMPRIGGDSLLIEGNLREGSALSGEG